MQNSNQIILGGGSLTEPRLTAPEIAVREIAGHLQLRFSDGQVARHVARWFTAEDPQTEYFKKRGWTPPQPVQFCCPSETEHLVYTLPAGFQERLEDYARQAGFNLAWSEDEGIRRTGGVEFGHLLLDYDSEDKNPVRLNALQEQACKALLSSDRFALEFLPGNGKTEVALNAWACLRQVGATAKALFVVPNRDLLAQTFDRIHKRSPWPEKVGRIGGGRFDGDANIVVATVQSACARDGLRHALAIQGYLATVDLLIIDEAHHATSEQYQRLLALCQPKRIWGLSGKLQYQASKRAEKQMILEGIFGRPVTFGNSPERVCPTKVALYTHTAWRGKVDEAQIPEGRGDMTPCLFQRAPGTPWEEGIWRGIAKDGTVPDICAMPDPKDILEVRRDGTPIFDRAAMIRDSDPADPSVALKYDPARMVLDPSKEGPYVRQGTNWTQVPGSADCVRLDRHVVGQMIFPPRNRWALKLAKDFAERGQPFLVTVQRLAHLRLLYRLFKKSGLKVRRFHGEQEEEVRKEALAALRGGQVDGLIATYSTVSEGTDVPNLVHLIKLDGATDEQVLTQQLGRVQRRAAGKKAGYIHIPVDVQVPSLERQSAMIRAYFASQGATIRDINL